MVLGRKCLGCRTCKSLLSFTYFPLKKTVQVHTEALRAATYGWEARGWRAQAAAYCKNALDVANLPPYQLATLHHILGRLHAYPDHIDIARHNIETARLQLSRSVCLFH